MFTQYFGQYLLNQGYITIDQLHSGLASLKETRVKLGVLAVNAGYMTANDAHKVNETQKRLDKRFGEIAVDMGCLNEEQVEELLSSQNYGHLLLGQALVDKEYITIQEFEKAVNEYKKDYSISDEEFDALQKDDVERIVNTFIRFEDSKHEKELKDYLSLFARNLIRFIDQDAVIRDVVKVNEYQCKWAAKQEIKGEIGLSTYIESSEESFIKFASKFAEEELNSVDEMVEASVGEFLNLQNGIFLVNMSNDGLSLEMTPQEVTYEDIVKDVYVALVDLTFGEVHILIKE